jgi:hypothetical protein
MYSSHIRTECHHTGRQLPLYVRIEYRTLYNTIYFGYLGDYSSFEHCPGETFERVLPANNSESDQAHTLPQFSVIIELIIL